jgi:cell division transport system permease protein
MLRSSTKLKYLLRETWLGIKRGGWMNWAAISTVAILLFLLGASLQISWQIGHFISQFGNQVEISAYLDTGVDANTLKPVVQRMMDVANVTAVSKEVAWESLLGDLGQVGSQNVLQQLGGNPLLDELHIKAQSPQVVAKLATELRKLPGVEAVQYVAEAVQQLAQLNRGLNWLSLGVTGFLTLGAIAVTTTTIRLIALARSRELEIMQLVGATRSWIYLPFLIQGVFFGSAGAWLAWLMIFGSQKFLTHLLSQQSELIQTLIAASPTTGLQALTLPLILMGFGSMVGILGSLLGVRTVVKTLE